MTGAQGIEKEILYIVTEADDGRLVKHIAKGRMGLSHKQFTSAKFREGGVTLDGRRALASDIVRAGQRLVVRLREDGTTHAHVDKPVDIVYEDEDIFVVNKPAPLPTQSSDRQTGDTLEARMLPLLGGRAFRPTNRLDKGTSGLMVVSRHPQAQAVLQKQLHTPSFVREYLAVVEGTLSPAEGLIDAPIGKADGPTVRREVRPDGKEARTHYRVVEISGKRSLVHLKLDTGRTHQIRVHMAHMGCPVYGDFLYGTERDDLPGRFALHSAFVSFVHPESGKTLSFECPLPAALADLLRPESAKETERSESNR